MENLQQAVDDCASGTKGVLCTNLQGLPVSTAGMFADALYKKETNKLAGQISSICTDASDYWKDNAPIIVIDFENKNNEESCQLTAKMTDNVCTVVMT